jgi:hypothetical protein
LLFLLSHRSDDALSVHLSAAQWTFIICRGAVQKCLLQIQKFHIAKNSLFFPPFSTVTVSTMMGFAPGAIGGEFIVVVVVIDNIAFAWSGPSKTTLSKTDKLGVLTVT